MTVMNRTEPLGFWKYFEEICSIPHGSGNTRKISDYLIAFAKSHGLPYYRDAMNNVIIIKEASAGHEEAEPLIIQGHMDMVCEKEQDCPIDMEREGLILELDETGRFLKAHGTTLGADDGVALAYGLALLDEPELVHPRLEMVFTVDEEIGMLGAGEIDLSPLKGTKLLNLDSEEGGIFITSCAGGVRMNASGSFHTEEKQGILCEIIFSGFKGGHSGSDIHLGHCNSNRIAARVLYEMNRELPLRLISMEGGTKDNVIPCYTRAEVLLPCEDLATFKKLLKAEETALRHEFRSVDDRISCVCRTVSSYPQDKKPDCMSVSSCPEDGNSDCMSVSSCPEDENNEHHILRLRVLTEASQKRFFHLILNLPNAVEAMSGEIAGLVETSSNLGILSLSNGFCRIGSLLRSMKTESLHHLMDRYSLFLEQCDMNYSFEAEYHGWEYDPNSGLRELLINAYRDVFHEEPVLMNLHAGLECGMLLQKKPDLDCVSIGPWIHDIHTVKERLDIKSAQDYWKLIHELIRRML